MKTKFDIGEWVEAKAVVYFNYSYQNENGIRSSDKREMFCQEVSEGEKKGRVVGMSYRNIGIAKRHNYDEPNTFTTTKRILIYLIKEGMINIPFECLEKDLKKILPEDFPFCKSHKIMWTKEIRKEMSEYSKEFPRDKKGRFI